MSQNGKVWEIEAWEGLDLPLLALKIEEAGHETRNVGSLWKLRIISVWQPARKQGHQSYTRTELNSAHNVNEHGSRVIFRTSPINCRAAEPLTSALWNWTEDPAKPHFLGLLTYRTGAPGFCNINSSCCPSNLKVLRPLCRCEYLG